MAEQTNPGGAELGGLGDFARELEGMPEREVMIQGVIEQRLQRLEAQRANELRRQELSVYLIPEEDRPENKEGWIGLVRKEVSGLRDLGESPYTPYRWDEKPETKRILNSIPDRELRAAMVQEVWAIQQEDKLYSQWRQNAGKLESLGELVDIAPKAGNMVTPDLLLALSSLGEEKAPVWLESVIPEGERTLSMQISRGVYIYSKFFGEWSETMASKLDDPGGIEDQGKAKWLAGEFGNDKKKWLSWTNGELDKLDWARDAKMVDLNKVVLDKLGFGDSGQIPGEILKAMFEKKPPELKLDSKFIEMKSRVDALQAGEGMSLLDLLEIGQIEITTTDNEGNERKEKLPKCINIFADSVDEAQVAYTRWLVSALSGGSYAEISALRFMVYTGESGQMNTTAAPVPYESDNFYHLAWVNRRRMSEARKRRPAGPIVTLGRYKRFVNSWIRETELQANGEEKAILDLIREGKWFHELPWGQLGKETYVGDFLLNVAHAAGDYQSVTNRNFELLQGDKGLLSAGGLMEKINKSFQYAFPDWEKSGGFERREAWANQALELLKAGKWEDFAKQEWSPWLTFSFGVLSEHETYGKLPRKELQSPSGVKMDFAILSKRWNSKPQELVANRIQYENSIPDYINYCQEVSFHTPAEAALLNYIMVQGFVQPAKRG